MIKQLCLYVYPGSDGDTLQYCDTAHLLLEVNGMFRNNCFAKFYIFCLMYICYKTCKLKNKIISNVVQQQDYFMLGSETFIFQRSK